MRAGPGRPHHHTNAQETRTMNPFICELDNSQRFFKKCMGSFTEADSGFAPKPDMMTVAQQVAHVAHTIDWFIEGMFNADGPRTDWENLVPEYMGVASFKEAMAWIDRSFDNARKVLTDKTMEEMMIPVGGELLGGMPRAGAVSGIADHTAHHRGSLVVYVRLLGRVPEMPYM